MSDRRAKDERRATPEDGDRPTIERLREANAALEESEQRLKEAQRLARIGNWTWHVPVDRVVWSDEMYRLSGLPIGTPLTYELIERCVHPADRARHNRLVEAGMRDHTPWVFDYRTLHPDGTILTLEARGHALYDEAGRPLICIGTSQDVTAKRAAEAELVRRAEELEQANRELKQLDVLKDEFLAVVSHELRTPINAMMGFASVLDDGLTGPLSEDQHHYVQRILSSADLLLALIDDLLDMSRISAGKLALAAAPLDLKTTVTDVLQTMAPLAEHREHRLVNELPAALPKVWGDAQRVEQVVINLVNNALKYTPAKSTVTVRARVTGDLVRCEVVDDGPGIAREDQAKLFKRFSQVGTGNTRAAKGTGLGLSIVKALIEAQGGQVGVESEPGRGSTFWFTLPLCRADAP